MASAAQSRLAVIASAAKQIHRGEIAVQPESIARLHIQPARSAAAAWIVSSLRSSQ